LTPAIDPRRGDIEDDASSTKRRSMLSLFGSLLAEISLPKLLIAFTVLMVVPGLMLGVAPIVAAIWLGKLSSNIATALAGFWPGNGRLPEPAFVAYTFPEPPGCRTAAIQPDSAYFHPELAEFVLPYAQVRLADDPDQAILAFYRSTYDSGATLAGWDRARLERSDPTLAPTRS